MEWYQKAEEDLERQRDSGEINNSEFNDAIRDLNDEINNSKLEDTKKAW